MSRVTGFVLHASVCEDDDFEYLLNDFLKQRAPAWNVKDTADKSGGSKHPQCHVFVGGFNYFYLDDYKALVSWLDRYKWIHPMEAIAIFSYEDCDLGFEDTAIVWRK